MKKPKAPQPHPYVLLMMEGDATAFSQATLKESSNPAYDPIAAWESWDPAVPGWVPRWFPPNGSSPQARLRHFVERLEKLAPSKLSAGGKQSRRQKLALALLRLEYEVRTGMKLR